MPNSKKSYDMLDLSQRLCRWVFLGLCCFWRHKPFNLHYFRPYGFVVSLEAMPSRSNPDCKTIRTVTGKTVELTPTRICLSNQQGLEIILDDQEGILIASNKKIRIRSEDAVSIAGGGGIDLIGMEKVQLRQEQASVELTESKLRLLGADVRMQ